MRGRLIGLCVLGCAIAVASAAGAGASVASADDQVVLGPDALWRQFFTWRTPLVRGADGKLAEMGMPTTARCACGKKGLCMATPPPPGDWAAADYDDSAWGGLPADATATWPAGWICGGGPNGRAPGYLAMLALRARFAVKAPADGFRFSIRYRGGVVVYLNGREIARDHLPAGVLDPQTPAEDYPASAYDRRPADPARSLDHVALPARLLRPGVNVLAVELHRSPVQPQVIATGANSKEASIYNAGVVEARLTGPADAIAPAAKPADVSLFNADPMAMLGPEDRPVPNEPLGPIRIVAAANGQFSGQVVVRSEKPLNALKAEISDLRSKAGAILPASALRVRFPAMAGPKVETAMYGALLDAPILPAGPVQPVWVTVQTPADAKAGLYAGTLAVRAAGQSFKIPVELTVCNWRLADPKDFFVQMNFYELPDSVADTYQTPMWSDRHFELIGQVYRKIAELGNKVVLVPLIGHTHQGHAESMVRWVRSGDGWEYDYTVLDRYLDAVEKNMPRPDVVVLKVWDIYGPGSASGRGLKGQGKGPLVTVLDRATGTVSQIEGPKYDSPESEAFWRPVLTEVRAKLKARGWEQAMVLGQGTDLNIAPEALAVFKRMLPDLRWMQSSHAPGVFRSPSALKLPDNTTVPIGYQENAYVLGEAVFLTVPHDPDCARHYAPNSPPWVVFPRANAFRLMDGSPLAKHRYLCECALAINRRGLGRLGADYWMMLKGSRSLRGFLPIRYPDVSTHQMDVCYAAALAPAPDGPISTIRFELFREGVQECEARVAVERGLAGGKLPADLAARVQQVIDERTRRLRLVNLNIQGMDLSYPGSLWQERSRTLFEAAGEVARATGK